MISFIIFCHIIGIIYALIGVGVIIWAVNDMDKIIKETQQIQKG